MEMMEVSTEASTEATEATELQSDWAHAVAAVCVSGGRVTEVTDRGALWPLPLLSSVSVEAG